jgi:hypothetical protein
MIATQPDPAALPLRRRQPTDEVACARALDWLAAPRRGGLFEVLGELGRWVASAPDAPEPGPPPARPATALEVHGPTRYAFALTVLPDALEPGRLLSRVQGFFTVPRMMGFVHVYRSRCLAQVVAMGQIWRHPGALPRGGERALLDLVEERLQGRFLRGAPSVVAGVGRLLLQVDAALYLARAQAGDEPLTDPQVLRAIALLEAQLDPALEDPRRVDPRLLEAWEDPAIAAAAASLFAPA